MSHRALTTEDVGRELGRSKDWMRCHWRQLVAQKVIPPPVLEGGVPSWSAAHVYAWLDRDLPPAVRSLAIAVRAALDAAHVKRDPIVDDEVERWREELNRRYAGRG